MVKDGSKHKYFSLYQICKPPCLQMLGKGLSCSASCAQHGAAVSPSSLCLQVKGEAGSLGNGRGGKRSSKGYREKKGRRDIWLPSSTGFFFLISVLHSSLKTWEVKAAHLQRMNEQKGEKQNREKCVENRADKKAGTCHKIPQHFIFVVTCKWPSEVVRGY